MIAVALSYARGKTRAKKFCEARVGDNRGKGDTTGHWRGLWVLQKRYDGDKCAINKGFFVLLRLRPLWEALAVDRAWHTSARRRNTPAPTPAPVLGGLAAQRVHGG